MMPIFRWIYTAMRSIYYALLTCMDPIHHQIMLNHCMCYRSGLFAEKNTENEAPLYFFPFSLSPVTIQPNNGNDNEPLQSSWQIQHIGIDSKHVERVR